MLTPSLRPASYLEESGQITVALTNEDLALCYRSGVERYLSQRGRGGFKDGAYRKGEHARNDIEGIIAEVAFWYLCGIEPDPTMLVRPITEWKGARGETGGQLTDVLGVEIRATRHKNGRLFVHKGSQRDGDPKLDTPFLLAFVDAWPYYESSGFSTGNDKIDAMLMHQELPHYLAAGDYQGRVLFIGWGYGREANGFFDGMVHPEHFIPPESFRPMTQLAEGRFTMPKSEFDQLLDPVLALRVLARVQ